MSTLFTQVLIIIEKNDKAFYFFTGSWRFQWGNPLFKVKEEKESCSGLEMYQLYE